MKRLGIGALCALAVLLLGSLASAAADPPAGPRLAVLITGVEGPSTKTVEGYNRVLSTIGPGGEDPQIRVTQPDGERPSWSGDGRALALGGSEGDGTVVVVDDQDKKRLRFYPRAQLEGDPVMAPDGGSVAFQQTRLVKVLPGRENYLTKSAIFLLDLKHGSVKRANRWRVGTFLMPSSFSPDGTKLAVTTFDRKGLRAVAIDLRSGRTTLLAREAMEPTYSPDGLSFAFVRWKNWRLSGIDKPIPSIDELRVGRVGAVAPTRLLLRRRGLIAWPSWDPSGQRLSFTHSEVEEVGDRSPQQGDRLMAVNADGSCLTKVFSDPELTVYGSAWRPGPGREAGPISC